MALLMRSLLAARRFSTDGLLRHMPEATLAARPVTELLNLQHFVTGSINPSKFGIRHASTAKDPTDPIRLRNFAVIAHVDHGKTTMMDQLMKACGVSSATERFMDSNTLEKERGITISSKYTSMLWGDNVLNAVDTPGHADFGGEVERVLGMVDGALLVVDANEGALSQTKFVLGKALKNNLRPLVILNKVDRPGATAERCGEVEAALFELFANLGATDEQLDFPVLYASGRQGWATTEFPKSGQQPEGASLAPLLDMIVKMVPPPSGSLSAEAAMLVTMIDEDPFVGRIATGRISNGTIRLNDRLKLIKRDGESRPISKVTRIMKRFGTGQDELQAGGAGDIVSVAGIQGAGIADTICSPTLEKGLPPGIIEPPTLSMIFSPNDSPLAGREGVHLTGSKIGERLYAEAETSVSLRVLSAGGGGESFEVQARGELQLGLLMENMRREGYEFAVSPPKVVYRTVDGARQEPLEELMCEVEDEYSGAVIEAVSLRKGELLNMEPMEGEGKQHLTFTCPSRGLIGFRSAYATLTRGSGLMHRAFSSYGPYQGHLDQLRKGAMVSMADGKTTLHALGELQVRGTLFIGTHQEAYAGQIIGESAREADMEVNPTREKKLSNVRTTAADEKVFLVPPRLMTLEDAIGYVAADELIEITPSTLRLRKRILEGNKRKAQARKSADR